MNTRVQRLNASISRHPAGKQRPVPNARLAGVVLGLDNVTPLCGICGGTDCSCFAPRSWTACQHIRTVPKAVGESTCLNCGLSFEEVE